MKRKSVGRDHSMCVQPMFLIGTRDQAGQNNFAPITWLSVTHDGQEYLIVISLYGDKKTRKNVQATGVLSANLVSVSLLPLADRLGNVSGNDGEKTGMACGVSEGEVLPVPVLDESPFVYELEVAGSVVTGESETFFCHVRNVTVDERVDMTGEPDLTQLDPVIYSGDYHSLHRHLGTIGDFLQ